MARVTMTHPDLEHRIEVDELAVPHHQAAGWQVVTDQPQTSTPSATRRRQTTRKES